MFKKFLIKNLAFTLGFGAMIFALESQTDVNILLPEAWFILLFFFLLNNLTHWLMMKSLGERAALLVQQFMKSMLIKFFTIIGIIAVYAFTNREDLKPFVVLFIGNYFVFLIFEVASMMKMLKGENKSTPSE